MIVTCWALPRGLARVAVVAGHTQATEDGGQQQRDRQGQGHLPAQRPTGDREYPCPSGPGLHPESCVPRVVSDCVVSANPGDRSRLNLRSSATFRGVFRELGRGGVRAVRACAERATGPRDTTGHSRRVPRECGVPAGLRTSRGDRSNSRLLGPSAAAACAGRLTRHDPSSREGPVARGCPCHLPRPRPSCWSLAVLVLPSGTAPARGRARSPSARPSASRPASSQTVRGYVVGQPTATNTVVAPASPATTRSRSPTPRSQTSTSPMLYVQITAAFRAHVRACSPTRR